MKKTVTLGLFLITALSACKDDSAKWPTSSNPQIQSGLNTLQSIQKDCPNMSNTNAPTQEEVDKFASACSASDVTLLNTFLTCFAQNCNGSQASIQACATPLTNLSSGCQKVFTGSSMDVVNP